MITSDDRVRMLQEQLNMVDAQLDRQIPAPMKPPSTASRMMPAMMILLVLIVSGVFLFKSFVPVGFAVLDNLTSAENLTAEQQVLGDLGTEVIVPEPVVQEPIVEEIPVNETPVENITGQVEEQAPEENIIPAEPPVPEFDITITPVFPQDGAEISNWVTFSYRMSNTSGVESCALYTQFRYVEEQFNNVAEESELVGGENYFELQDMQPGEYIWKVGCTDGTTEIQSDERSFVAIDFSLVNLTNESLNITNVTIIPEELNLTNVTFNLTNVTLNLTNVTLNITNVTLNLTNVTLNLTNVTNVTLNLTNLTINLTNVSLNLTNVTLNLTNVTNVTINMTNVTLNVTNITNVSVPGLPEELVQGQAEIWKSVNWTKRIMITDIGEINFTTYLPRDAENITIYEIIMIEAVAENITESTVENETVNATNESVMAETTVAINATLNETADDKDKKEKKDKSDKDLWEDWNALTDKDKRPLPEDRFTIKKAPKRIPVEVLENNTNETAQESQTPAITGFFAAGGISGDGVITRFFNWMGSIFGVTGASVIDSRYTQDIVLTRPVAGAVIGRNLNFLYNTDTIYDSCSIYLDGQLSAIDRLVLSGVNFFEVRSLAEGEHSWYVDCVDRGVTKTTAPAAFTVSYDATTTDQIVPAIIQPVTTTRTTTPVRAPSTSTTATSAQPATQQEVAETTVYVPYVPGLDDVEINITDSVNITPKVYEIVYSTPAPEKYEQVRNQYLKEITISSDIGYTEIKSYTETPWVPAWLIKLNWLTGPNATENAENLTLIDANEDGLIESIEWTVPHLSNQTYALNLSYNIIDVNVTAAEIILRYEEQETTNVIIENISEPALVNTTLDETSNTTVNDTVNSTENITAEPIIIPEITESTELNLSLFELISVTDGNFTPLNKKYLKITLDSNITENDTVSFYAWSNKNDAVYLLTGLLDQEGTEVISTATIKKNEWRGYNLTISGLNSTSDTFYLYSDSNVKYDFVNAYDKQLIIPKKIVRPTSNVSLVLSQNEGIDVTEIPQFGPAEVMLKNEEDVPIAEFDVYFENAELDINLSTLIAQSDNYQMKSVVHMDNWPAEISHNKTLYIPSSGIGVTYVCPEAKNLSEVNPMCAGRYSLHMGENNITSGNDTWTVVVTEINKNGTLFYKVAGVMGTGGGELIEILNVHSYPSLGGQWTVDFTTVGMANLTITPKNVTTFTEFLLDLNSTVDDLEFLELSCGETSLTTQLMLIGANGTMYNYTELAWNDSLVIEALFISGYFCADVGHLTNIERYGGAHELLFQFGEKNGTAFNYVSQVTCEAVPKASCSFTDLLYMSSQFNAHAELVNQSNYDYSLCCQEVYGEPFGTNCSAPDAQHILNLEDQTNAHVEKGAESNYPFDICVSGTEYYNMSCSYASSCPTGECIASISSTESGSDTNLQIGNCTGTGAYTTKICCSSQELKATPNMTSVILNATSPLNLFSDNLTAWPQNIQEGDGDAVKMYYNWYVDDTSITVMNLLMSMNPRLSYDDETIFDVSGNENHGRLGALGAGDAAEPVYDEAGGYDGFGAFEFDGVDDYLTAPSPSFVGQNEITAVAWVKSSDIAQSQNIMSKNGPFFLQLAGSKVTGRIYNGTWSSISGDTTLQNDAWYHLALTYDAKNIRVYVNGAEDGVLPTTGSLQGNGAFYIGHPQQVGYDYIFNGSISDVKVYNRALSPEQILVLYQNKTNLTVSQETQPFERWNASVTPVDAT
ncbi:MAG: LamG-like jellyroll fold domain-containing protein, partial [Candidatus Woesearchaeota archaeon]